MKGAQLQGADLKGAQLQGADLRRAELYGAVIDVTDTILVDLRAARWTPLEQERLAEIREMLGKPIRDAEVRKAALERIEHAGSAGVPVPVLGSCLIDPEVTPGLKCQRQWLPAEIAAFQSELFPVLEKLVCESSWIAGGLIRQIELRDTTSGRFGLAGRFAALLDKRECEGLRSLPEAGKDQIHDLAKWEQVRRGQSEAGQPAEEAPAPPTPPPAVPAATP